MADVIVLSDDSDDDEETNKKLNVSPRPTKDALSNNTPDFNDLFKDPPLDAVDEYFGLDDDNHYFGSDDFYDDGFQMAMPSTSSSQSATNKDEEVPSKQPVEKKPKEAAVTDAADKAEEDGEEVPAKRRKKRTKEEIEQEKLEKEVNKIRRQIQSSKNSKCEQYMFCHFSTRILSMDDSLKEELRKRFEERAMPNQLVYDNSHDNLMRVIWRRKRVEASLQDNRLQSSETMELQNWFFCLLSGETFTVLAKTKNGLMSYMKDQVKAHRTREAQPTLIVLGKHTVRDIALHSLMFELYENFRVQIRFMQDALELSFAVVQMHRSLAKFENKSEKMTEAEELGTGGTHFVVDKGIVDGPGIVADWWARMLDHMHRLSEEQKRAILQSYPNPIKLMDYLLDPTNSPGNSMFILSEIQMEGGRRLGPVLAQKIFRILTSMDGTEIIDSGA